MQVRVARWGNSLRVRIPKDIARHDEERLDRVTIGERAGRTSVVSAGRLRRRRCVQVEHRRHIYGQIVCYISCQITEVGGGSVISRYSQFGLFDFPLMANYFFGCRYGNLHCSK
jgi:antitoxin component of MazEF toxin-antitoxin module